MGKTAVEIKKDALALIRQTHASYRQLSKALCGKENATLEEVLQAVSQVKAELAAVKRERDAAVSDLTSAPRCKYCKHEKKNNYEEPCNSCSRITYGGDEKGNWQWRGVCPENTEDEQ